MEAGIRASLTGLRLLAQTHASTTGRHAWASLYSVAHFSSSSGAASTSTPQPHVLQGSDTHCSPFTHTSSLHAQQQLRPFSSSQAEREEEDEQPSSSDQSDVATALKHQLLERALAGVKEHGWSGVALEKAAIELGLSPAVTGLLPRREGDLVEFFIACCNQKLLRELQSMQADGRLQEIASVRGRLAMALKLRLQMLEPVIESWPQALSIAIQPRNAPTSLKLLGQLVDDVWAVAGGDKSTDYNYYTKRGLLAGVYTSTELFMLTDYTPGFADTWQALSRRLDDVVAIGKSAGSIKSAFEDLAKGLHRAQQPRPSHTPPSSSDDSSKASSQQQTSSSAPPS